MCRVRNCATGKVTAVRECYKNVRHAQPGSSCALTTIACAAVQPRSTGTPFLNYSLHPEVVQGGSGFSMLTITTSATGNRTSSISSRLARMAAWLSSTFILSFVFLGRRRGTVSMVSLIALLAVAITLGCGSSSSSGAKAGNLHAITITASSGQLGPVIIHVAKLQVEAAPN